MMKKKFPIGLRLTLWYLLLFAVAQAIFGVAMWAILRHNLYDIADDALESQVEDVQRLLKVQRPGASPSEIQQELAKTYNLSHSGDYLQIQGEQGNWLYRSPWFKNSEVAAAELSQLRVRVFEDKRLGRKSFRLLSQVLDINGQRYIVQIGGREADVLETL